VNLSRVRLLADKGDHYLLHDGAAEFRVPKNGLSKEMHERIQSFASGGQVEGRYGALPKPRDATRTGVDVKAGDVTLEPRHQVDVKAGKLSLETHDERKRIEHEEETDSPAPARTVYRRPPEAAQPSFVDRVSDFARRAATSVQGMAEGGGVEDLPPRRDAGPVVFVPAGDGGLRPVPMSQLAEAYRSYQPPQAAPAPAPAAPTGPVQGPVTPQQAAVRQVYETTGPAGAQALGRLSDEPLQRVDATRDFQRDEQAKLTTLKPRVDGGEAASAPAPAPAPPKPTAPAPRGYPSADSGLTDLTASVTDEQRAIRDRGDAEAEQAKAKVKVLGATQEQLQANAIAQQQRREQARIEAQQLGAQRQALSDELKRIDTKVDPGRYWASRSTGQKVLGAIGLALGAVGAGADGVNRAALLMGQAIDRDIEAQKAEHTLALRKGEQRAQQLDSIYAQNRGIYQDDLASLAASKATALELADNQVQQAAATYASPIAKANAAALSAQLQGSIAKFKADAAAKAEERRHHIALEGIESGRVAAGAGGDKEALHTAQAVRERAQNIRTSLDRAEALINRSGTFELTGPDQGELQNTLSSIATDMAKLKDPQSAARPGEVEQEEKNIGFQAGTLTTRNGTAVELLKRYRRAVDAREQEALKVRGFLK
jgi:hypothetical protein